MPINLLEGHFARARYTTRIGSKAFRASVIVAGLFMCLPTARLVARQDSAAPVPPKPIETTVCEILKSPDAFNNKLVQVRGRTLVSSEYSMIEGYGCSDAIWLAYGDGSGPPGLVATTPGQAVPGEIDSQGARVAPIRVKLVLDSNLKKFQKLLASADKANKKYRKPDPNSEDFLYGINATFIGRIDGVSPEVHAAHLKMSPNDKPDWKGFGQMGMFDAQLVVQSVEGPFKMEAEVVH